MQRGGETGSDLGSEQRDAGERDASGQITRTTAKRRKTTGSAGEDKHDVRGIDEDKER